MSRLGKPYKEGPPCSSCQDHCGAIRQKRWDILYVIHQLKNEYKITPCTRPGSGSGSGLLCTNSCPVADLWTNCAQLAAELGQAALCDAAAAFRHHCRATCSCQGAIY